MEVVVVIFLFLLYFLPSIVAFFRNHHNKGAILALNTLLGITVLGWIGAFVWSCTAVLPKSLPRTGRSTRGL